MEFKCRRCVSTKAPGSDDQFPDLCDDCWSEVAMEPEAVMFRLVHRLGYEWQDKSLLTRAFYHSSYANSLSPRAEPNERLEFLGDSVLDLLSAEFLMVQMPDAREGRLSHSRANLVRASNLAMRARELDLGYLLYVGPGQEYVREVEGVLADTMEALIGAAYMDGGIAAARQVAVSSGVLR